MVYDPTKFEIDTNYDPAEFNIPVDDAKGHSVMQSFRFNHRYQRAMQTILASRRFPYLTVSDIIRHAVHRHVDWLTEIEHLPAARTLYMMIKIGNERLQREMEDKEMLTHFSKLQQLVDGLLAMPDGYAEARSIVSRELSMVRQVPQGFFRDQYLAKLMRAFGSILEGKGKPRLRPRAEDAEEGAEGTEDNSDIN